MSMNDAKLRLRQCHRLELRLILRQSVDVRHADQGILVVEPEQFVLHEVC